MLPCALAQDCRNSNPRRLAIESSCYLQNAKCRFREADFVPDVPNTSNVPLKQKRVMAGGTAALGNSPNPNSVGSPYRKAPAVVL